MLHSVTGTVTLAAAGAAEGETMQNPIIPHMPELIWSLVVFAILYLVVRSKVFPTLEKTYRDRASAIEGGMERAEKAQAEAEDTKRRYEALLADARTEAAHIREEAREQGASIIAEMRGEAQAEAARITETAQKQIAAERQSAMTSLRGDLGRMSTDLASRIVGESLHDEARQRGIVERFIADLEAGDVHRETLTGPEGGDR